MSQFPVIVLCAIATACSLVGCAGDDDSATPEILQGLVCTDRPAPNGLASPDFWDDSITAYEERDAENPPAPGSIVFIGSSSVAFWRTVVEDMAPLHVLNRGFGGSIMTQATNYVDRIVTPYAPSAVVLYEGDNDIAFGISPECVLEDYDAFVAEVHATLPDVPIYFLAIKPSLAREPLWPLAERTNDLVEARTTTDPRLHYIDVATPLFDDQGDVLTDIFIEDGLHMNATGYAIWTSVVRPILLADLG